MSKMYTQEEFDAAILANKNKFNDPESIEGKLKNIEYKMDSCFPVEDPLEIKIF